MQLILADGALYPHTGSFSFADCQVDVKTGPLRLLVPQLAATELQGSYQVAVVRNDNQVEIRPIMLADRISGSDLHNLLIL